MRRVALVAGGTAGHVYPALAVARAYRQRISDADVLFIGATGLEARLIAEHEYRLASVPAAPLFGVGAGRKALALARVLGGFRQARRLLQSERTQLVLGFGGYASAGTMLAACTLGLRTAILEPNVAPGLTNRLLGRFVDRVYLGYRDASSAFSPTKTLLTGMPVRAEIAAVARTTAAHPPFHVLVSGGSLGSAFLNGQTAELLRHVAEHGADIEVLHQAGARDLEAVRAAYCRVGITARVTEYIEQMAEAYAWAHFAITCAGAGTLAELATVGLPALLVPLSDASEDHQTANARRFAALSGSLWVRQQEWNPALLADAIAGLLTRPDELATASGRLRQLARATAADAIVADCEAALDRV